MLYTAKRKITADVPKGPVTGSNDPLQKIPRGGMDAKRAAMIEALRQAKRRRVGDRRSFNVEVGSRLDGGRARSGGSSSNTRSSSSSSTSSRNTVGGRPADPLESQIDAEARLRFQDQFNEIARQRAASNQMDVNRNAWFNEYRNRVAAINAANQAAYDKAQQVNNALAGMNVAPTTTDVGAAAANQRQILQGSYGALLASRQANEGVLGGNRLSTADLRDLEAQKAERRRAAQIDAAGSDLLSKQRDWKTSRRADMEAAAAKAALEQAVLGNDVQKTKNDLLVERSKLKQKAADTASARADRAAQRAEERAQREADRQLKRDQLSETARHHQATESGKNGKPKFTNKEIRQYRRAWYNALQLAKRDISANGKRQPKDISKSIVENPRFKGVDPFIAEAAAAYILYGGVLTPTARRLKSLYGLKIKTRKPAQQTAPQDQYGVGGMKGDG